MRKLLVLIFLVYGLSPGLFSQDTLKHIVVPGKIINGDTLPFVDMKNVVVFPEMDARSTKELMRYERLVYNVIRVYPYAKLAAVKLTEYKKKLESIPNDKDRKKFMKQAEKELEAQFGEQIKDLSFNQGKILIKLIYRQTGNSTFDIVRELRGSFNAFVWQTVARIFGYDLKTEYDPVGDDKAIERVVQMIDSGTI
jgi:hypothetical protein